MNQIADSLVTEPIKPRRASAGTKARKALKTPFAGGKFPPNVVGNRRR